MKRVLHYMMVAVALGYMALLALPTSSFWYEPGPVMFKDAIEGHAPKLVFTRTIHRETVISYATATRPADGSAATAPCVGDNGSGFEYQPDSGPVVDRDLVWWSGGNPACMSLPAGQYWTSTTWTIPRPMQALLPKSLQHTFLASLLPPRTITRDSPPFTIYTEE